MAFYERIPLKYMAIVPALYFAAIGSFDIISDATHHKLTAGNFLFNVVLFVPLVFRHQLVYIISGVLSGLFAVFASLAIFVWFINYLNGAHFSYLFDTFVIGPIFACLTLLCGLSLIYAGRKYAVRSY